MTAPPNETRNVAIAGASDVAKYLIEELTTSAPNDINNNSPKITVLTRSLSGRPWFTSNPHISLEITDYTTDSILSILNKTGATVLFSFLHSNDPQFYLNCHKAMLAACRSSERCHRFIPSDYGGNIEWFPGLPRFFEPTHRVLREEVLEREDAGAVSPVEWTVVNLGWFMDYFVQGDAVDSSVVTYTSGSSGPGPGHESSKPSHDYPAKKPDTSVVRSYMKPSSGIWPLNLDNFTGTLLGTGNEPIAWTSARDVARALVALLDVRKGHWEKHTYVVGEIGTWNKAIRTVEEFFGRKFTITQQLSVDSIRGDVQRAVGGGLEPFQQAQAYMNEWNVAGATAVPVDRVLEQRRKFFTGVKFRGIRELLQDAFVENPGGIV